MSNEDLKFSVNIDSAVAVYVQIENLIQFAITAGHYKPGDLLPSVREMSATLGVNPNTVTKSYRDLELMGLVYPRRGVGVTITEKAPKLCRDNTKKSVLAHLQEAVSECIACGLPNDAIQSEVKRILTAKPGPYQS